MLKYVYYKIIFIIKFNVKFLFYYKMIKIISTQKLIINSKIILNIFFFNIKQNISKLIILREVKQVASVTLCKIVTPH